MVVLPETPEAHTQHQRKSLLCCGEEHLKKNRTGEVAQTPVKCHSAMPKDTKMQRGADCCSYDVKRCSGLTSA